jgi:hypothetical protein
MENPEYRTEIIEHKLKLVADEYVKEQVEKGEFKSVEIISVDCSNPSKWMMNIKFEPHAFTVELLINRPSEPEPKMKPPEIQEVPKKRWWQFWKYFRK